MKRKAIASCLRVNFISIEKTALFKNGVFWGTKAGEIEPNFDLAYRTNLLL